jgi:sulfate adenylyltransferase
VAAAYGATHLLGDADGATHLLGDADGATHLLGDADPPRAGLTVIQPGPRARVPDPDELRYLLDRPDPLPVELASPAVAGELLAWRPPRAERGVTVFFTGLSGSGKSTVARMLVDTLHERSPRRVTLLDGDEVRHILSSGLGFSRADRDRNIERIGWVAAQITRHGGIAVCAPIAPYAAARAQVRRMVEAAGDFVLIHVATPLEECERRDRKGLYAKARAGLLPEFTGVSDPYEAPVDADLVIDTSVLTPAEARDGVLDLLITRGYLPGLTEG